MCTGCNANRILSLSSFCECPENSLDLYLEFGSPWCSTCEIGVPYILMSTDYMSLKIDFGFTLSIP